MMMTASQVLWYRSNHDNRVDGRIPIVYVMFSSHSVINSTFYVLSVSFHSLKLIKCKTINWHTFPEWIQFSNYLLVIKLTISSSVY